MLDDEKCLCGSGRLYSMCCKPFSGQGIENYKKEIDSKNYIKAYYVAVAMLSDYLDELGQPEEARKYADYVIEHGGTLALRSMVLEKRQTKTAESQSE